MKINIVYIYLKFLSILLVNCGTLDDYEAGEQELILKLFKNYNKNVRPNSAVTGYMKLFLRQITSLDEKSQIMTTSTYFAMSWFDNRLAWDENTTNTSANYVAIYVPVSTIWIPDMYVLNTASSSGGYLTVSQYSQATIRSDGYVYMILTCIGMQTRCKLDVRKFPFDSQKCSIVLTSWGQTSDRLNFDTSEENIDRSSYVPNPVWYLDSINLNITNTTNRYPGEVYPNEEFQFIMTIKRWPLYYMITGIFPCFVLNAVSLLSYALPFTLQISLCLYKFN